MLARAIPGETDLATLRLLEHFFSHFVTEMLSASPVREGGVSECMLVLLSVMSVRMSA